MASGRNHDRAIVWTTPLVGAVATVYQNIEIGLIVSVSYYFGGLCLSCDLDLVSRPYKRWGYLRWLWIPYQRLIPYHRHWLSHGVIVGSIVRLLYLAALLLPMWFLFPGLQQIEWDITWGKAIAFFLGVELSALNHLLLDGLLLPLPASIKQRLKGN